VTDRLESTPTDLHNYTSNRYQQHGSMVAEMYGLGTHGRLDREQETQASDHVSPNVDASQLTPSRTHGISLRYQGWYS
jgi:hypothetical protein